ncbi:hypothetical protein [Paenibacillus sp. JCM 10914]|uniref:hypothetical protein n=1 Tax=Paenibacillus sp. JCM 10914 TaxID=1236974 RepID=UPI0003CC56DA|nr:hypothetical protein [Paenibacillus sp. JCM 10914]GAE08930.1 hypothetical protein JCM10914_5267 [Paenibacillus sp. JCM 10914]
MQQSDKLNLREIEKQLSERFKKSSDFVCKNIIIGVEEFAAYYLESLVNLPTTLSAINQAAIEHEDDSLIQKFKPFEGDSSMSLDGLSNELLQGKLILFSPEVNRCP